VLTSEEALDALIDLMCSDSLFQAIRREMETIKIKSAEGTAMEVGKRSGYNTTAADVRRQLDAILAGDNWTTVIGAFIAEDLAQD
jgi:hypothetical protein